MASENETVADIVKRMKDKIIHLHKTAFNNATEDSLRVALHDLLVEAGGCLHDIEAAHRREIAVKNGERKGLLKANESLAADNTRLRGEVAELREDVVRTGKRVDCQKVVIIDLRRRLRVAEDALKLCISGMCGECSRQHPGKTYVNGCYEMTAAKNALDAIREKTKTKGE